MKDKINVEIKSSDQFENDPEGALDALSKTGFAIFIISETWLKDERAQKEWRFAKDLKKPMLYIFRNPDKLKLPASVFDVPHLIGTINDYGDFDQTKVYVGAIMEAYIRIQENKKSSI